MPAAFDPYYQWLAIPPDEQPPNHYRLLGLKLFEANADVIDSAADRQMVHVRSFQTGERAADSQRLLNELSAARVCLLNADKKTAYDLQLRARIAARQPASPAAPVAKRLPQARPLNSPSAVKPIQPAQAEAPAETTPTDLGFDPLAEISASHAKARRKRASSLPLVAALGVAGLLAAGVVAYMLSAGGDTDLATTANRKDAHLSAKSTAHETATPDDSANPELPAQPASGGGSGDDKSAQPADTDTDDSAKRDPATDVAADRSDAAADDDAPNTMAVADTSASDAADTNAPNDDARLPVPDDGALKAAVSEIQKLFKDDYAAAKKSPERAALAEKLLGMAADNTEPTDRYALLFEARRLAVAAPAPALALRAIEETAEAFDADRAALSAAAIEQMAQKTLPPAVALELAHAALAAIDEATSAGQFEAAARIVAAAAPVARKGKLSDEFKSLAARGKQLAVQAGMAKTADAAANQALGEYLCFALGDWASGLPHLQKSADPLLQTAAKVDLAVGDERAEPIRAGDAWWDAAEAAKGPIKDSYRARAGYWYRQTVGQLTGLSKTKVEKRLSETGDLAVPVRSASAQAGPAQNAPAPAALAPASSGPARLSAPRGAPQVGRWFDLLPITDPARQKRDTIWHRTDAGLVADAAKPYPLALPVEIVGNYDLHLEFIPSAGHNGLSVAIPAGAARPSLVVGGVQGDIAGLDPFDDKWVADNPTTVHHAPLESGKTYALDISVRSRDPQQAAISAKLNGEKVLEWQGNVSSLGAYDIWNVIPAHTIAVNAWVPMAIPVAKLKLLSGSAKLDPALAAERETGPKSPGAAEKAAAPTVTADKIVLWNTHNER